MDLRRQSSGEVISLDTASPLGKGGEAQVYAVVGDETLAAKVYAPDKAMSERILKLTVMCAHPPDVLPGKDGHVSIAWPMDLLCDVENADRVVGFLMGRVQNASQVIDVYNPQNRLRESPLFDYRYLLRTARNLAAAVRALHARGYVIGDLKHSNVLVTQTALVTLVDTDSFQVRDPQTEHLFACPVRTPDFTPPELQETGEKTQKTGEKETGEEDTVQHPENLLEVLLPEHDLFALGVLIFHLLMEGTHPFAGVYLGEGDPPPFEERIAQGHFPHGTRTVPYRPSTRHAPPFDMLPPTLRELFLHCFEDGHTDPAARPDASTWQATLDQAGRMLSRCTDNPQHFYSDHLTACPWCERKQTQMRGIDPFPSEQAVQARNKATSSATTNSRTTNPSPDTSNAPLDHSLAPFGMIAAGAFGIFCICMIGLSGHHTRYSTSSPDPLSYSQNAAITTVPEDNASPAMSMSDAPPPPPPILSNQVTPPGTTLNVACASDSKTIAGIVKGFNNNVVLWDAHSGKVRHRLNSAQTTEFVFTPDGKTLVTAHNDKTVKFWDTNSGKCSRTLHFSSPVRLAISHRSDLLATGTYSGGTESLITLWDTRTGSKLRDLPYQAGEGVMLAFSPTEDLIASSGGMTSSRPGPSYVGQNGQVSSIVHRQGVAYVWNAQTGELLHNFLYDGLSVGFAFSPDGDKLEVEGQVQGGNGWITHMWDIHTGQKIGTYSSQLDVDNIYSPDGGFMVNVPRERAIEVQSAVNGATQCELKPSDTLDEAPTATPTSTVKGFTSAAFMPDSKTIVTGSYWDGIQIWDAQTGVCLRQLANPITGKTEHRSPSGLRYLDLKVGTGPQPQPGQMVTAYYVGKFTDGKKFDSSRDHGQPFKFELGAGRVIKGWEEGVATMRQGGTRRLIVPPELAYGSRSVPLTSREPATIPPNSTLIFDIELLKVDAKTQDGQY